LAIGIEKDDCMRWISDQVLQTEVESESFAAVRRVMPLDRLRSALASDRSRVVHAVIRHDNYTAAGWERWYQRLQRPSDDCCFVVSRNQHGET
jgi:hypothetical protein